MCAGELEMVANCLPPSAPIPTAAYMSTTEAMPKAPKRRLELRSFIFHSFARLLTDSTLGNGRVSVVGRPGDLAIGQSVELCGPGDRPIG
jgi:hypothetical protein